LRPTRSLLAVALVALFITSSLVQLQGGNDGRGPGPLSDRAPLPPTESITLVQEGDALAGADVKASDNLVTVPGGLSPPSGELGHAVTANLTVHEGKRWDFAAGALVLLEGSVTLEVRDPAEGTYPGGTVLRRAVVATPSDSVSVDLRGVDASEHVELELAFILDHRGRTGAPPTLVGWTVGESDPDMWQDPFYDVGRDESRGDLFIGRGSCYPDKTHIPGGLLGDYYGNRDFTGYAFTRLDQTIDYDWGNGGPGGGVGGNTFSVRWEGKLMAPSTDDYTLLLTVDDGGRLWIDGSLVIDEWRDQAPTEFSATLRLVQGLHDIRIDYYENQGGASCELRWRTDTMSRRVVPPSALWGREATNVLVSEEIQVPDGHVWDLLFLRTGPVKASVWFDLFDAINDVPILGYQSLTVQELDLSKLSASVYPRLQIRARWAEDVPANQTRLDWWGVKWMPERTWRCEFITDLKLVGTVGLSRGDGFISREGTATGTSMFAFSESFDGQTHLVDSTVYQGEFWRTTLPTVNATDVAIGDLDGDGMNDVVYTHGELGMNATGFRGTAGGFRNAPTWTFAMDPDDSGTSYLAHVVLEDMDGDGDTDVLLVSRDTTAPTHSRDSLLVYLNNGTGFQATPDHQVAVSRGPVSAIDAGDVDGDGMADVAIGHAGSGAVLGSFGMLYIKSDWSTILQERWVGHPVLEVFVGDLDGDDYEDVFTGGNLTGVPRANNGVFLGTSAGLPSVPSADLDCPPAVAGTFADWNGDGRRDVFLATEDSVRVFIRGTGASFTTGLNAGVLGIVDLATIRAGGDGDEDVAYAGAAPYHTDPSGYMEAIGGTGLFRRTLATFNATAVASAEGQGDDTGSLRTGVIDVGEPTEVGSWGWLSYRPPTGSTDYDIKVVLRDAGTEEELWSTSGHPSVASFNISGISIQEHPRVYIELFMENRARSRDLDLGHLEINWTERFPEAPRMLSLVADDATIYRTNSTVLRILVEDERDRPGVMDITVQMRPPQGGGWISDRLGDPVWDGGNWTVTFRTTRDDPAGAYSFRAWVTDSDMLSSEPLEALDLVTVVNNPPGSPDIGIEPDDPLTTDDIACTIVRQAFDKDTSYLEYAYAWYVDGEAMPGIEGAKVPENMTSKGQTWRVVVRAFDGEDLGPPVEASVTVHNSPPRLVRALGPLRMLEDDPPLTLRLSDHFSDPDGDDLSYEASGPGAVGVQLDPARATLTLTLPPDWNGRDEVTVNVTDGALTISEVLEVRAEPVPDAPVVVSVGGKAPVGGRFALEAAQATTSVYDVEVRDTDSTSFKFRSDARFTNFGIVFTNGTITFTPINSEVGEWTFNITVEDGDGNLVTVPVDITVSNKNDMPGTVFINNPKSGSTFEHDASILLQGTCSDPDEIHGQELTFTWRSSIDGELGTGRNLQVGAATTG